MEKSSQNIKDDIENDDLVSLNALKKWYVVNVYSGFENKVAQTIEEQAKKKSLWNHFEEILIPSEEVVQIRKGEKVKKEANCFPGYILIKMALTDETWHIVRNTPRVSSFLGSKKGEPTPISQKEVDRILKQLNQEKPRFTVSYDVGEQVRVIDGAFTSFSGMIEEVDNEKYRLKVSVMIFGRPTPVDLEFTQVEKI